MEKYIVKSVRPQDDDLYQTLDLEGINKAAMPKWNAVYVYRLEPRFQIGDTFKLYTDNSIAHISKAYSYKINGKTFVDIQLIPQTRYSLEHFYDDMSAIDALRMKYDVACALRTQKIRPTLSAANNLRLLISELPFLQKTM